MGLLFNQPKSGDFPLLLLDKVIIKQVLIVIEYQFINIGFAQKEHLAAHLGEHVIKADPL